MNALIRSLVTAVASLTAACVSVPAWAGAAPARLECVATTKAVPETRLRGWVPYEVSTLDLTLIVGGVELHVDDSERAAVVTDLERGVFTLAVPRKTDAPGELVLYAVPKSVRTVRKGPYAQKFMFEAVLQWASIPGSHPETLDDVPMSCTWTHEI